MISGVVVVEFRSARHSPPTKTIRVLVRNAENLHDAIVRGVFAAIELLPETLRTHRAVVCDFVRVDFDLVA